MKRLKLKMRGIKFWYNIDFVNYSFGNYIYDYLFENGIYVCIIIELLFNKLICDFFFWVLFLVVFSVWGLLFFLRCILKFEI